MPEGRGLETEAAFVQEFKLGILMMTEVWGEKEDILFGA